MALDVFKPAALGKGQYPRHRSTLILSLLVHGAVLMMLVMVSLAPSFDGPLVARRLEAYLIATPLPPPPPPPPARPRPVVRPAVAALSESLAPIAAPLNIRRDIDVAPAPKGFGAGVMGGIGVPGGVDARALVLAAPPPLAPTEIPRVGGDIRPPARLVYVPPDYPALARSARVEGEVVLEAVIDETGAIRNARVIKSVPLLDRAAIEAVTRWRYSPTTLNGVAVPVIMTITVRFALR